MTLLRYPWANAQPAAVTRADLDFYVPRTDPNGPSMTDAIHSILSSELGTPGCSAYSFTRRSVEPFMRGPYAQFSESRTGGAFTFTTGAGGFLQEWVNGYPGVRWSAGGLRLDPSLPPQLRGVVLRAIGWRGRTVRIAVGRRTTRVTLLAGRPLRMLVPGGWRTLGRAAHLVLPTRRPDLVPTANLARCRPASARPDTAEPPEAAVDGTVSTSWLGQRPGTTLRIDLGRRARLGTIVLDRPEVLALPVPKKDEARTAPTRSAAERVAVSADGRRWLRVASVRRPPRSERFALGGRRRATSG